MSNKENNLNDKEVYTCEKCGAEASCYNSDSKIWLCEKCKNEEDELEKNALKLEKKLSKRPYSFDLKELIECLSKDEIYNIARNLGISKISSLNKDKLTEKVIAEYKDVVSKRLDLFDEKRDSILSYYVKHKGAKNFEDISEEEAEYSAYFIQQGILYPAAKDEKSFFLMPEVVQELLKKKKKSKYAETLASNTEIINTYIGMNRAYGILEIKDAISNLQNFFELDLDNIEEMLKEAAYFHNEYREENGYLINNEINEYQLILQDIKDAGAEEYASISKEELLSMSEDSWVFNSKAGRSFYKEFISIFSADKDMTEAMMNDLALDVQECEPKEAVDKMVELIKIDNEEAKVIATAMMNKFVNKLRVWRYKGLSTNDFNAVKISAKSDKLVGRNDPCPCGSGKKYKKCCGKNQ